MDDEFDDLDLEEDPDNEPDEKYPQPNFSNKTRKFRFEPGVDRVDLGQMFSGYYLMPNRRRCISEHNVDRSGQIFETYFFSTLDLERCDPRILFQHVKAGHRHYDHDPDIKISLNTVQDCTGHEFFALAVLIADRYQLFRKRPPVWWPFQKRIPVHMWSLYQTHRKAQRERKPFVLIQGQTGDCSWGDSDVFETVMVASEAGLADALNALPNTEPLESYTDFNHGVVDARDPDQPFNESIYTLAKDWSF